jgi:hypothetical protein
MGIHGTYIIGFGNKMRQSNMASWEIYGNLLKVAQAMGEKNMGCPIMRPETRGFWGAQF